MALRIGPGPVFVYETLILARRRQVYAGRALFIFLMFLGLAAAWWITGVESYASTEPDAVSMFRALARAGERFFDSLAGLQLALVLLVAPAATAGAICHDRARGIFDQLAMTDLSNAEIVLGKLGSRLAPILGVLTCALPVPALAALLGGIDPQALFSLFAVSVAIAVLGCSLALAISLRAAKTHEVVIAVMALWILWLLSLPIWSGASSISGVIPPPDWFQKANPVLVVYAPYAWPGYVTPSDVAVFVTVMLLLSAALIALTIATVRRSVLEPARRVGGRAWLDRLSLARWLPGPSLDRNPVLWREWHRTQPSRLMRIIWVIYIFSSIASVGIGIHEALVYGTGRATGSFTLVIVIHLQFLFGLTIASIQAPTSLAEERVRGSLDVLLTTPLSTRTILWGKWLGSYRVVLGLAILPAMGSAIVAGTASPSRALSLVDRIVAPGLVVDELLAYGAAITSMGLALATWTPRLGLRSPSTWSSSS